ncbi:MAG: hypothetical protein CTY31_12310 [Hyphomicrobium sp.]|nr:MAG: hypothetical protein CTY39_08120 [Hyphomicrobium sp.]PPC98795.1 MAG: hypothetical protein CTY31_12310 [Hyphomicrobium sp.]
MRLAGQRRAATERGRDINLRAVARYRAKHPERAAAQTAARIAEARGLIIRPRSCEVEFCERSERLHKHHCNYSKPADVIFVCLEHHEHIHHCGPLRLKATSRRKWARAPKASSIKQTIEVCRSSKLIEEKSMRRPQAIKQHAKHIAQKSDPDSPILVGPALSNENDGSLLMRLSFGDRGNKNIQAAFALVTGADRELIIERLKLIFSQRLEVFNSHLQMAEREFELWPSVMTEASVATAQTMAEKGITTITLDTENAHVI